MITVFHNASQVVTVNSNGKLFKRGNELNDIGVLENHSVVIENDLIKDVLPSFSIINLSDNKVLDLSGKIILPGLIDCHTHIVYAGSRANEFKLKLQGISYEEIAAKGGGIQSTVNQTRNASKEELFALAKKRIEYFISQGITSLEIKSGYGLNFESEIKILEVIKLLNDKLPIDITPTFLGAHTFPLEYKNDRDFYIKMIIEEMLPYISENKLAENCDGFCESTAFNADEIDLIFNKAKELGFKLRLHTEQFNSIGGLQTALKHDAISVDHLEVLPKELINNLAISNVTSVLLPGVSFFLNYSFAPARELIDNNGIVALSTDFNPGSSHILNLHFIMSLAAMRMKMTPEEIISAVTINAANVLGISDKLGSIEQNKKADLSIFETDNYENIIYSIGQNLCCGTVKNGELIYKSF